jgi:two-component system, NtrC family, C4-dicarboxylate transport sensor histidine kinase DctB
MITLPRKQVNDNLHEPAAKHIIYQLPVPVIITDTANALLFINNKAQEVFCPTTTHLPVGMDVFTPDTAFNDLLRKKIRCYIKSGRSVSNIIKLSLPEHPDKYLIPAFQLVQPECQQVIVSFTDATAEEILKERIRNIHSSFKKVFPGNPDENLLFLRLHEALMQSANTIVITDLQGNIVFANPRFEETTGYTLEEAYMKNPRIVNSGAQPASFYKNLWTSISSGNVWKGEFRNKNKSGDYYWEAATITPIKNAKGEVIEYLAIKEDITPRKTMEERLEKTMHDMEISNRQYKDLNVSLEQEVKRRTMMEYELQKQKQLLVALNENLENQVAAEVKKNREKDDLLILQSRQAAMGEMIGNIAHQWRQPLNTIGLMVYDLTDALRYGEISKEYIDRSEQDIKSVLIHMSRTIDDFRNFFKPDKEKQHFPLHEAVNTATKLLDATFRNSNIAMQTHVDNDIMIYGYPGEFAQVLLNIINNARDALMENRPHNRNIEISGLKIGQNAVVKIANNGGSIPAAILDKIFDPYFTTKEPGKGTGVGLYMSKTIIEKNMNGIIQVQNLDDGTSFIITVPQ